MMKDKKMKPAISVVIPVYNAEKYLDQSINSVLGQDCGLENIELVLVNDGSKDSSGEICQRYAEDFPDNVVFVDQENKGVSEARNNGIKNATGRFIGFLDADDYMSINSLSAVMRYFDSAPKDVDVAIIRVIQFGYYTRERSINDKFDMGTRTIDLNDPEWYDVYPRVAPAFIRANVAKRHEFDKSIGIYEDTRYIGEVLSENMKLGVVSEGVYYNRIHYGDVNASITTGAAKEKRFYLDSPEKVSLYLLEKFKGNKKYPPIYFQFMALYEMRWRVFYNSFDPRDILSEEETNYYSKVNKKILDLVSDEAISRFKLYNVNQRIFLLNIKHDKKIIDNVSINKKNELVLNDVALMSLNEDVYVRITDILLDKNEIIMHGHLSAPITDRIHLQFRIDGRDMPDLVTRDVSDKGQQEESTLRYSEGSHSGGSFEARLPIGSDRVQTIDFIVTFDDSERAIKRLRVPSPLRYGMGYRGNYKIAGKVGGIIVYPATNLLVARWVMAKTRYLLQLMRRIIRKLRRSCIQMIKTLR